MTERIWEARSGSDILDDLIDSHVREGIKEWVEDTMMSSHYLPMTWFPSDGMDGGKPPEDALTVRFTIDDLNIKMDFSVFEALENDCDDCIRDGSFLRGLRKISVALHKAAKMVDEAVMSRKGLKEGESQDDRKIT